MSITCWAITPAKAARGHSRERNCASIRCSARLTKRLSPTPKAITAGLIEFAFVRNDVSGGALVVLTLSLVVYAVHVPVLIGFTVARYD